MAEKLRIVFAGGGTAGHLYPALNLAQIFEKLWQCEFLFFGTLKGIESTKVPQRGYKLILLSVRGFHRRFSFENFLFPFRLISSLNKSRIVLKKFKPHFVVGTGGYVMGPVLKVAAKLKIPVFIQEQNSFPGVTTRMLSKQASAVFVAYEEAKKFLDKSTNTIKAGNPVLFQESKKDRDEIVKSFGLDPLKKTILVFGGSQGAASINRALSTILLEKQLPQDVQLLWQTGKLQYQEYMNWSDGRKFSNVVITPFIDDMWSAYSISEFCICRAGAMSLSELAIAGLPAILIPLKSAAGNHQYKNAKSLEERGCAKVLTDDENLAENLFKTLLTWLKENDKIVAMQSIFKSIAQADAGTFIVNEIHKNLIDKNMWPEAAHTERDGK
ncbi:MAG: undecaprenyldiphospho-muramoylpentapeptide beta-N-acetylglucosaminyltransferase [Calditrichaeota bacterium]|nr:undecaprenyldiphospho-muramoylpentapeptide beta-N-acetylglucosaminyltransferase [Calditrichota bacterium]